MSLTELKIKESEFVGKDIKSLPDKPSEAGITAAQLKAFFDSLAEDLISKRFNSVIDLLASADGAANIGATLEEIAGDTVGGLLLAIKQREDAHFADRLNPHGVTQVQVGLGRVDNTSDAEKPVSEATRRQLESISTVAVSAERIANLAAQTANGIAGTAARALLDARAALEAASQAVVLAEGVYYQFDPTDGQLKPIQDVLYSLYNSFLPSAISCGEYDSLGLTAGEYDSKNITAQEFDTRAKQILIGGVA